MAGQVSSIASQLQRNQSRTGRGVSVSRALGSQYIEVVKYILLSANGQERWGKVITFINVTHDVRTKLVLKRYIYLVTIKSSTEFILVVEDGSDFK